jgi:hypothetical protein
MIRNTTSAAPLAQLRDAEPEAWSVLMAMGGSTEDPEHQAALQSTAAHMLGDHDLARKILSRGFYEMHVGNHGVWPDLGAGYPTQHGED